MDSTDDVLKVKAKELASTITDFINVFHKKEAKQEFCEAMSTEHRTLQQDFTGLCLAWIEFMGNTSPDFQRRYLDGRNEYSNEICTKIRAFMLDNHITSNLPFI